VKLESKTILKTEQPDSTAVRTALWRALHVQIDSLPHVLKDEIGLQLVNPDANWQQRPDMHPQGTSGYRAGIVARARYIEDLVIEQTSLGIDQFIILGAGLDTFAQRRPDILSKAKIFEVDRPKTQEWKRRRLIELGFGVDDNLKFVPVDFEAGESWLSKLVASGFDPNQPSIIASTGVAMYLTKEANNKLFCEIATLAHGTIFAMTFLLTLDLVDEKERPMHEMVYEKARVAGTPIISFFGPKEIMNLASEAGFSKVKHVSRDEIIELYFLERSDNLKPASGEEFLIGTV
jgi:methyltransferase (TIGR00027 family)